MAPRKPAKPGRARARPAAKLVQARASASQPPAARSPSKNRVILACILKPFEDSGEHVGSDTAPKDLWSAPRWDPQANAIAKSLKEKFPGANQAQLKQRLVDDYGTAIKTIAVHLAPLLP